MRVRLVKEHHRPSRRILVPYDREASVHQIESTTTNGSRLRVALKVRRVGEKVVKEQLSAAYLKVGRLYKTYDHGKG